jgi:hypothetical protein
MPRIRVSVLAGSTAVVIAIGAGIIGAVATGQPQATGPLVEPRLGLIQTVTDWRQITLPLDAYELSLRDGAAINRAEYQQTKACMGQFGFAFDVAPWDSWTAGIPESDLDASPSHYRFFGLLDEAHAAQYGYHVPETQPAAEKESSGLENSRDYANVLGAKFGGGTYQGQHIPDGGCIGQARQSIAGGGPSFDSSLPEQLTSEAWDRSDSDSRVISAYTLWSACMKDAGFDYRTPADANNDTRWSGEEATPAEIAVASADVTCKKQTNLVGIRMAVDSAYQRVAIQAHAQELDALKSGQQRQRDNAAALLALASRK